MMMYNNTPDDDCLLFIAGGVLVNVYCVLYSDVVVDFMFAEHHFNEMII